MTTVQYNPLNQPTKKTLPDGQLEQASWDAAGNVSTLTDSGGVVLYQYDADNRCTKVTDRQGNATNITYDADGNQTQIAFPGSGAVKESMTYDSGGQLTSIGAVNAGNTTVTSNQYTYTDPNNHLYTDQWFTRTVINGTVLTYTYDAAGRVTQATSGGSYPENVPVYAAGSRVTL